MITDDEGLGKIGMECALKVVALDIGDELREVHENFIRTAKILRVITTHLQDGITKAAEKDSQLIFTAGDKKVCEYLDNSLIPLMKLEKDLSEVVDNYNEIFTGLMRTAMPLAWNTAAADASQTQQTQLTEELQEDQP